MGIDYLKQANSLRNRVEYQPEQIIYTGDNKQFLKDYSRDEADEIDINGVPIAVDDSGYKTPNNFLAFSKVARGNQRDTGLIGWSDEDIAKELAGLIGNLSKHQKALKQRLTKEQKARTTRNKQKKSGERGTGTGRR
jgi:hypothetical protein